MSLIFWRKSTPSGDEKEHGPAVAVTEQEPLPTILYWPGDDSTETEVMGRGHPLPIRIVDSDDLRTVLQNPIRFAKRVRITCAAAADYAAGDVLSASATDTAGRATYVDNLAYVPGGMATIQAIKVYCSEDAVLASLRLYFFRDDPAAADVEMDDNAVFSLVTARGRDNLLGDGILLNALADRGALGSASTTVNIQDPFRVGQGQTGAYMVATTEVAEANESAGMTLDFEFLCL